MRGEVAKVITQNKFNKFWENVINYYKILSDSSIALNESEFVSDFILFNQNILIDSKIFYIKEWVDKDILQIKCLMKNNEEFLNYQEFQNKCNTHTNFLTYHGLIHTIKKYQKRQNIEISGQPI